jgi:FixJ family two-component response regulator
MISIVDDDKSVRNATSILLGCLGYATVTFASVEEFLQSGRLSETACLITDVQMPSMREVDLQNHLIAIRNTTPVNFIIGFPDESGCFEIRGDVTWAPHLDRG